MARIIAAATKEPNSPLLLPPRIGQGFGETCNRKIRRRCGINDCGNDAGRQKGEGSEQADVPFALGFMLGDLSEGGKPAEPNALGPSSGLGDCGEQSIASFGTHRRFCGGRMKDALNGHEAWRDPGKLDREDARGSYSYALPGHADARVTLATPLDGRVFFAGEACSRHNFTTAHGAYLTGIEAADQVIALRPC